MPTKAYFKTNEMNSEKIIALLKAAKTTCKRTDMPDLENILIHANEGIAVCTITDLEFTIQCEIPCMVKGVFVVNRALLLNYLLKTKAKEISIRAIDDNSVLINGLRFENNSDYPNAPELVKPTKLSYSALLNYELKEAKEFVSDDYLRAAMTGILLSNKEKQHRIVATNTHILYKAILGESDDKEYEVILSHPDKIVKTIETFKAMNDNVELSFDSENACLQYPEFRMYVRLIDGKYPNVDAVIPTENNKSLTFDKTEFLNKLEVVSVAADKVKNQVVLELSSEKISMVCFDIDSSLLLRSEFSGAYSGEEMEIHFNFNFIKKCFSPAIGSEITIEMSLPNKAAMIHSGHRLVLIMPVMNGSEDATKVDYRTLETA